jgi:hypothetical protein
MLSRKCLPELAKWDVRDRFFDAGSASHRIRRLLFALIGFACVDRTNTEHLD